MKPSAITFAAGFLVALITAQSLGAFGGIAPSISSPVPLLLVVPIFLGVPVAFVVLLFVGLFWVWSPSLFRGEPTIPLRTIILFAVSAVLSLASFAFGWHLGVQYEGATYTVFCALLSVVLFSVCAFLLWRGRTTPSFANSLAAHAALFAWLGSYAFAYLGETP